VAFYLAVDTSTDACSVAAWLDGAVHERFEPMQREHTARLLPLVDAVLAQAGRPVSQLDGIACGIGPGSFAGLRIGIGVVKGLALARDLPVAGASSLAMLAQRAMRLHDARQVACALDAKMKEVYVGAYERGADGLARAVIADCACVASAAPALPAGRWRGVGTGWAVAEDALRQAMGGTLGPVDAGALPHAEEALHLAVPVLAAGRGISADVLAPAYLRERVALTLAEQAARKPSP
jgi:tRNA threonylcarbamoyladenosine biosynthesis protein TsaB